MNDDFEDFVCRECGIIVSTKNLCKLYSLITENLNNYLITDLINIVINFLKCPTCKNILHNNVTCCNYMCNCDSRPCLHFNMFFVHLL